MLGGLRVFVDGRQIERFQTLKTGALLAYLALRPGHRFSREAVAELLWPDGDPTAIRNRLNQAVSSLRRQLHPPESQPRLVLIGDHHHLAVDADTISTDVAEFQAAIADAGASSDRQKKIRLLKRAVGLYRGDLLESYYEDWLMPQRMHLADQFSDALDQLIRMYSKTGQPEEAIPFAIQNLKKDLEDAGAHCTLMDLYLRADRPKSALRQFEEMTRVVVRIPEEALALRRRAEREVQQPHVELPPKPTAQTTRTVSEPERGEAVLPKSMTRFLGREVELEFLRASLHRGDRLVSLLGLGGCGKTRLAIEAAWSMVADYGGNVFFVSLAAIHSTTQFVAEVGKTVAPESEASWRTVVKALTERERSLMVLDNAEHLVPDISVDIRNLLNQVPKLQLLVTSRRPLSMEGEAQLSLAPLPIPEPYTGDALHNLAANASVALFVARAQLVRPDFQLTDRTAESVAVLCRQLEGLPLAIELAATWARTMTPTQMVEQVASRFDLLESRRKDISPRHRSIRATLDASLALLTDAERDVFIRVSFFKDGFTSDAARHLCPGEDVLASLDTLAERSLVSVHGSDVLRFSMLEILRSYAQMQTNADLKAECGWLHADYFQSFVVSATPAEIDVEYANIVAALQWLADTGHVESALVLAAATAPYWESKGRTREGRDWFESLFGLAVGPVEPGIYARARLAAGKLSWLLGDYSWARHQFEAVIKELSEESDDRLVLEARFNLQLEAHRVGEYELVAQLLQANLALAGRLSDDAAIARCWLAMGNASVEQSRWDDAREQYELSLAFARKSGGKDRIAQSLNNLGNLAVLSGQSESGRRWLTEALELFQEVGHRWHHSMALLATAKLDELCGDRLEALRRLNEAFRLSPDEDPVVWRVALQAAFLLTSAGLFESAAQLYGFVERTLGGAAVGTHPIELAPYDGFVTKLRANLPAELVAQFWGLGRTMTVDEAATLIEASIYECAKLPGSASNSAADAKG